MKRSAILLLIAGFFGSMNAYAEDVNTAPSAAAAETVIQTLPPVPAEVPAAPAVVPALPVDVPAPAVDVAADNLEFISGEVGEMDETGKTITVKLYGETESATTDKTLKVSVDASTDITDGEQDRDFKSLAVGTEVDVEYDPATNKATYIFVY